MASMLLLPIPKEYLEILLSARHTNDLLKLVLYLMDNKALAAVFTVIDIGRGGYISVYCKTKFNPNETNISFIYRGHLNELNGVNGISKRYDFLENFKNSCVYLKNGIIRF